MFDINQIYKVDNFLDESESTGFDHLCGHYVWEPNGFSHNEEKMFWKKDLWESKWGKCEIIESTFRTKLEKLLGVNLETERLYLNAQAHGQCGDIHSDLLPNSNPSESYITAVYYVNKEWSPELGGFTVIIDRNEQIHVCYPKPNSVVVFDSSLPHVGLEPTIHCKTQRITLAHKMRIIKG